MHKFKYYKTDHKTHFLPGANSYMAVEMERSSISATRAYGSRPGWPVPEAVITVVRAPDDGCQHPKHVEMPTEM